jgi:uncharacterized membrane protein HdeD (DUF308 family)
MGDLSCEADGSSRILTSGDRTQTRSSLTLVCPSPNIAAFQKAKTMNDNRHANAPILGQSVRTLFKRSWWVFLLGGIASTLFGLLALAAPGTALVVLALYFAASILVDGAVNTVGAIQNRGHEGWWIMLIFGLAGILIGGYALLNPPVSIAALILLASLAALILGIALITLGYKIRAATEREWMLYLAGALSVGFGLAMYLHPMFAGLSLALLAGAWALIVGVLRIMIAFKVRKFTTTVGETLRAKP